MTRRHGRYGRSAGKIAYHRRIAKPTIRALSTSALQQPRFVHPVTAARHLPAPVFYDMLVIWDYLRRERPWAAKPTKVQLRGENLSSIQGNKIRLLFSYWAKYLGDLEGNVELPIIDRSDSAIMLRTDREGIENSLLNSRMFFGVIDGAGRRLMAHAPIEVRKVAPADYRSG